MIHGLKVGKLPKDAKDLEDDSRKERHLESKYRLFG